MADHGTLVNPEASRNLPKQVYNSLLVNVYIQQTVCTTASRCRIKTKLSSRTVIFILKEMKIMESLLSLDIVGLGTSKLGD